MIASIKKVVIIIPTYNESLSIENTIQEVFKATCIANHLDIHVLIFDSASTDNTQELVLSLQEQFPNLHLSCEPKKTGLGSAYLQAMKIALAELKADIVVEFDADLSHQPRHLLPMIEQMHTYDVVVGSRYVKGGSIPSNWGWHRKFLSVLGNYVARLFLTPQYKDFTSGFRATHYLALNQVLPQQFISSHYAYKLELFWRLHQSKAKICEYPIHFVDRTKGESKLPNNSIIDSLRVLITLRYRELKSYFSMCTVGLIGLTVQCVVYNLLRLKCTPFFSAQVAVGAAIVNNFVLNNQFTFKRRYVSNYLKSAAVFVGYSCLMIGLQSNWVQLGVKYWGDGYLKENAIIAVGVLLGSLFNYLFYSRVIWPEKKSVAHAHVSQ